MHKKDVYKYYNLTFRHRKPLNEKTLKALKRIVWNFFTDIAMTDVKIKRIKKPSEWKEE